MNIVSFLGDHDLADAITEQLTAELEHRGTTTGRIVLIENTYPSAMRAARQTDRTDTHIIVTRTGRALRPADIIEAVTGNRMRPHRIIDDRDIVAIERIRDAGLETARTPSVIRAMADAHETAIQEAQAA